MSDSITRKCQQCPNKIDLEKEAFIYDKEKYYHTECLLEYLTNKKRNKLSEQQAKEYIDNLLISSQEKGKGIVTKVKFYKWLNRKYEVVFLPKYLYEKFEQVFAGKWKGMTRPIPVEDIWDIWMRQWNYIQKTYNWKKGVGGEPEDAIGRINYDLAIVLGKSNSYYEWKETWKEKEDKIKELSADKKIDYALIAKKSVVKQEKTKEDYIIEDEDNE
jgi:hypothetical protein